MSNKFNIPITFDSIATCSNLFIFVCLFRDLRGNKFECDCKAKWLFLWLKMTNSTVSDVLCVGPAEFQDKKLNDVSSYDDECTTTGILQNIFHCKLIILRVWVTLLQDSKICNICCL